MESTSPQLETSYDFTSPKREGVDENLKLEQDSVGKCSIGESASTSHKQQQVSNKPPFSYKQLIAQALMTERDSGLLLCDIYSFINRKYPFYKMKSPGWQNSIRHNLSLHKGFENVPSDECLSEKVGKGNCWRIKNGFEERLLKRSKKQCEVDQGDPLTVVNKNVACGTIRALENVQKLRETSCIDFKCQKCDFVAYKQSNLEDHIRQVHEQIPYFKCMWCTYATSRRTVLGNHVGAYHKEKMSSWEKNMNSAAGSCLSKVKKEASMKANLPLKVEEQYDKPPFTYSQLIAQALLTEKDSGLPLRGIYSFINKKYHFYKMKNPGWQNSIRHNLSLNEGIEKVGKNNCWRIKVGFEEKLLKRNQKQRKVEERTTSKLQSETSNVLREPRLEPDILHAAISILEECQSKYQLDETKMIKCEVEGTPIMSNDDISNQEDTSKELSDRKCPVCPFQTTNNDALNMHLLDVHEIVQIPSNTDIDGMTVDEDSGILEAETDPLSEEASEKITAITNTTGTLHCIKCNFSTNKGRKELKEHEKREHEGVISLPSYKNVILNCAKCNFSTRNGKQHLKDHEMRVHRGIFFKCDSCAKTASRKGNIEQHKRRMHQGVKRFKCTICQLAKYEKKQVIHHVRECHPEMDVEEVIIKIAGYNHKGELIKMEKSAPLDHKKPQTSTKIEFNCMMCTFTTSSKKFLSMHMINEHKDKLEEDLELPNIDKTASQIEDIDNDDERIGAICGV